MVEDLQPSWLESTIQQVLYRAFVAFGIGLIVALMWSPTTTLTTGLCFGVAMLLGCVSSSAVFNGITVSVLFVLFKSLSSILLTDEYLFDFIMETALTPLNIVGEGGLFGLLYYTFVEPPEWLLRGLIAGLVGGFGIGSLGRIETVEAIGWSWKRFLAVVVFILVIAASVSLLMWVSIGSVNSGLAWMWFATVLISIAVGGLIGAIVGGVIGGTTNVAREDKFFPNEGIWLSWRYARAAFLASGLTVGLIVASTMGMRQGLTIGSICGLVVGLGRGGSATFKHYSLRLVLWLSGQAPLKLVEFLDHGTKLILLKKVGGGYVFVHRMLLEYFANLQTENHSK